MEKKLFSFNRAANNPDGSTFPDLASSLRDGFNGHYDRTDWKKTGKKNEVIATTVWENSGGDYRLIADADIHYNSDIYYISDSQNDRPKDEREIVDMQSLALHELGHLLGLAHVDPEIDGSSIMNPSLYIGVGLTSRSLSIGDVERIQKIYGCDGSACNQEETAKEIMLSSNKGVNTAH